MVKRNALSIMPLGGISEIGKNILAMECNDDIIRHALSTEGVIIVILSVEKESGKLLAGPEILTRGFVYIRESMELIDNAKMIISKELAKINSTKFKNHSYVKGVINKSLSSFLYKITGRRPVILPIIQVCSVTPP
ncbi:MAG: hypothetical protein ACOY46_11075 [Bacillota bacterium]